MGVYFGKGRGRGLAGAFRKQHQGMRGGHRLRPSPRRTRDSAPPRTPVSICENENRKRPRERATPSRCQRTGASPGSTVPHMFPACRASGSLHPGPRSSAGQQRGRGGTCSRVGPSQPRGGAVPCRGRDTAPTLSSRPACVGSLQAAPPSGPDAGYASSMPFSEGTERYSLLAS